MPSIKILCFHPIFGENATILGQRSGFEVVRDEYKPEKDDFLIIFGTHTRPHVFLQMIQEYNTKIVVIQTEQLESEIFENKYYIKLLQHPYVFVYDWSEYNAHKLKRTYDVKVRSIYSFDFYGKEPYQNLEDRPIDIFFCGSRSPKREKVINQLKETYPHYKFFVDFDYNLTEQDKLCSILKRSKIVLNIPFYDGALETHRCIQAKACGCEVLSYYSSCDDLNTAYDLFIHFSNNFVKALKDLDEIIKKPKLDHKEWNNRVNSHSLKHNIEQMKNIISLMYNNDEEK